jgi:hypothetical protein
VSRQPAGGAIGPSSSSSSTSFPHPTGMAAPPREIPSDGGGGDVYLVVPEFGIGEIRASTVVVVYP